LKDEIKMLKSSLDIDMESASISNKARFSQILELQGQVDAITNVLSIVFSKYEGTLSELNKLQDSMKKVTADVDDLEIGKEYY